MAKSYHQVKQFLGLDTVHNPRDIGNHLSKAQNVSIDKHGMIRTIGGLEDFTKVDNVTALTQTAKLCPGSGLFTYGSDHWRGTDTIVDILAADNAASDEGGEVDAVGSWAGANIDLTSVDDTDGGTIGTNNTPHIIKGVLTAAVPWFGQAATSVIGQYYKYHVDVYNVNLESLYLRVTEPLTYSKIVTSTGAWVSLEVEFIATAISTTFRVRGVGDIGDILYIDDAYASMFARRDLDTNWLALVDAPNAQVDLYNVNDDSFTAGVLDFGTVSSFVGASAGNVDFPTVSTITDSASTFLNQGVQAGDVRIVSGCTTTTANNIIFVVDRVTAGTIYARGSPFTVTAAESGTVTLTKYNPVAFHYVNEALRASPADGGIALRPKHYSFADRTHFEGADSSERKWSDWYANDVGPVAPTDVAFDAAVDSGLSGDLTAGAGWEVGMTVTAEGGEWAAGTYILACSFIYDDGQESALYVPTTDVPMTAITEGASLTLCAKADTATNYDERISGGRVYCRLDETDDPWSLLMDISMAKGARASLSTTYNAWAEGATADDVYTASFISKRQNLDSYESLAGADPTTPVETFSGDNAFWNASVIAGNRCFIFAPRYTDAGGNLQQFRDRIMYSDVNAYDTFRVDSIVDVVRGDAEDYVTGGVYGNDLLCFKQRTLYIIDISDPDPAGWQMKQDKNKGKYPFRGIAHPGAYFETTHGPAWCNEFGVFLYTGNEIIELLKDKIELSEHPLAYQRNMEFDGTDDYVTKSNDADLNFGANTDFSLETIFRTSMTALGIIIMKGSLGGTDKRYSINIEANGAFTCVLDDGTTIKIDQISDVNDGEGYHGTGTYDRDGNLTAYIDGAGSGSPTDISAVGDIDDATEPLALGIRSDNLSGFPFDGDIALARIWNRCLTAAEVLALYNGQPVLYADVGANQTELTSGTLTTGKRYRIVDWITDDDFTNIGGTNEDDNEFIATGTTPTKWTNSSIVVQIGCVAEYAPKGIGDATWEDQSENSLDGTVVGATAIKEDSWASFWTNYSILGYQALTNQLIIMRDCTGKWSSGQDYGDCMIVDLDTGAVTTGRRIFTKGIAYSNWATNWNQELIIAEQTSSTSVTIKRWTDEPQSQAAGLIDIRTADFDFGNPAIKDIVDAFIASYKSSAAQTNPLSYALDNDDRQTAWTRITGDFDPEGFFEKYVAEPTSFNVDSIRLKIDNPTAAGTMEINDMQIRHEPQELKLS